MRAALGEAGRFVASLLLGLPAGAALYLLVLAIRHPLFGALLVHHPLLVLPAALGGAGWTLALLTGLVPASPALLHGLIVAAACVIYLTGREG